MKTYLITGGAGFIGSTLVDELIKNKKIIVVDNFNNYYDPLIKENNIKNNLDNPNYKLYRIDICDYNEMKKVFNDNQIDCVIHLAAMAGVRPSIENPILYQQVNSIGTQVILELIKENNIKSLVMASSSSVYGNTKEIPFKEDMIVDYAISPYAATKKANEVMTHVYHKLYDMNVIMLRFFTVYGPKQRPDLAISKFTNLIMNNKEIIMYGDGTSSRDYTYVTDIVDGIISSINYVINNKYVYEIINLGNEHPIKLMDMINTIEKHLNINAKVIRESMQSGDVDITYANISKAKQLLGYNPKVSFDDGIKKFVEYERQRVNK